MARVEMFRDFDWRVPGTKSTTFIALKAGEAYTVKRQCADDVAAANAGRTIEGHPEPVDGEIKGGTSKT